ncbi:MAG: IMS domain-containing protein [Xenococcaceae cyanobacterium MO_188.B29]|nr:IMS domain-containing protein [Xenococcaceae cyanobacterium MO_188.B29]
MLIPLDYYRILGVPIQATDEQIAQAYHDRERQKPRREYSEMAIAVRKEILTQAYKVLSSPLKRTEYDNKFLQTKVIENLSENKAQQVDQTTKPSVSNPAIEVSPTEVVGALLILQELGEYELVLRSGIAYLNSADFTSLKGKHDSRVALTVKEDTTLTLALAYLELGREQWQKGEYENAALSGEMGYNLLVEDNLYPSVQSEIETDLHKLRPYRILELMNNGEHQPEQKAKAFQLLKEMLNQRQGIEGQGIDHSGLNFEQFLCFIQQLRQHLTATEQQELFEAEAKRPSAVATYLTVYTLLAKGFANKEPRWIVKGQQLLQTLSKREDVAWEQAICALLLGQTQEANMALQKTREEKILNLIQQHSQESPDLLPGLCFYGEKWLHQEVLSQFRDLANCKLTLKEYFADRKVQAYLEKLYPNPKSPKSMAKSQPEKQVRQKEESGLSRFFGWSKKPAVKKVQTTPKVSQYPLVEAKELAGVGVANSNGATATLPKINAPSSSVSSRPPTPPVGRQGNNLNLRHSSPPGNPSPRNIAPPYHRSPIRKNKSKGLLNSPARYALLFISMIWGIGVLGFIFTNKMLKPATQTTKPSEDVVVKVTEPPAPSPSAEKKAPQPAKPKGMNETVAKQAIENWLESKSAAMGSEHKVEALNSILVSSLLSTWRERALHYKQTKEYREYQHEVKVRSVNFDEQKPNQAVVEAEVREKADHHQGGKLIPAKSYDENLLVRYHLLRQGDKWFINKSAVVKTL